MNKEQALQAFYASFDWPAYDENTVPDDAELPYITYEVSTDNIGTAVFLSASLWDRSTSWGTVTQKLQEIAAYLGNHGITLPYDGGAIWMTRGSPFAQRLADDDDTIRRIMINLQAEFISEI